MIKDDIRHVELCDSVILILPMRISSPVSVCWVVPLVRVDGGKNEYPFCDKHFVLIKGVGS
jgi:hypothetical protein